MGVFQLGTWLNTHDSNNANTFDNTNVSHLAVDMNHVFHFVVGQYVEDQTEHFNYRIEEHMSLFVDLVMTYLYALLKITKPKKVLYLAIDGIAPYAKIKRQRASRYGGVTENSVFDRAMITVGTPFMLALDNLMQQRIHSDSMSNMDNLFPLQVVWNGHLIKGEGEHKIMTYLRDLENDYDSSVIIHGMDGDLVFLSMLSPAPKIQVLRTIHFDKKKREFKKGGSIQINAVKYGVYNDVYSTQSPVDIQRLNATVHDFVFMMTLIGNDFVPALPMFKIVNQSIRLILLYYSYFKQSEQLAGRGDVFLTNFIKKTVHWDVVVRWIHFLETDEKVHLENTIDYLFKMHSNGLATKCNYASMDEYEHSLTNLEDISEKYMCGLGWTYSYYTTGKADPFFFYPSCYPPTLRAIKKYMNIESCAKACICPIDQEFIFFTPIHTLLATIPPSSKFVLQKELYDIIEKYPEFFPQRIKVDTSGLLFEKNETSIPTYRGFSKIPPIDLLFLFSIVHKLFEDTRLKIEQYRKMAIESETNDRLDTPTFIKLMQDMRQNTIKTFSVHHRHTNNYLSSEIRQSLYYPPPDYWKLPRHSRTPNLTIKLFEL